MKTRNGLFADVPENLWNDWHWQVANRAETVEDLKKYMTLTPDEEAGVAKTLGKLRMAVTPYYLSPVCWSWASTPMLSSLTAPSPSRSWKRL